MYLMKILETLTTGKKINTKIVKNSSKQKNGQKTQIRIKKETFCQ